MFKCMLSTIYLWCNGFTSCLIPLCVVTLSVSFSFLIQMLNSWNTYSGVMTEFLVFHSIALIFMSQTFMIAMSCSVIALSTNTYPILLMVLLVSISQTFGARAISNILRIISSSLVYTDASITDWGYHYVSPIMIMWVHYLISHCVVTLESKYTVFASVFKGMNTFF